MMEAGVTKWDPVLLFLVETVKVACAAVKEDVVALHLQNLLFRNIVDEVKAIAFWVKDVDIWEGRCTEIDQHLETKTRCKEGFVGPLAHFEEQRKLNIVISNSTFLDYRDHGRNILQSPSINTKSK